MGEGSVWGTPSPAVTHPPLDPAEPCVVQNSPGLPAHTAPAHPSVAHVAGRERDYFFPPDEESGPQRGEETAQGHTAGQWLPGLDSRGPNNYPPFQRWCRFRGPWDSLRCVPVIPVFVPVNLTDIDSGPAGGETRHVLEKNSSALPPLRTK